mmetsp:Transcript_20351/g.28603  ORF Transcript_20351/g.28603 Transcript_20351/m.28603 type:complete len:200 (+) Transcript_20351:75-674(+)
MHTREVYNESSELLQDISLQGLTDLLHNLQVHESRISERLAQVTAEIASRQFVGEDIEPKSIPSVLLGFDTNSREIYTGDWVEILNPNDKFSSQTIVVAQSLTKDRLIKLTAVGTRQPPVIRRIGRNLEVIPTSDRDLSVGEIIQVYCPVSKQLLKGTVLKVTTSTVFVKFTNSDSKTCEWFRITQFKPTSKNVGLQIY